MSLTWVTQNYLTRGFWGDEAWTAGISRLPILEIIRITGEDFHPPLYYFLVHFFGGLFDFREVPVRLLSTLFFLFIPVITFYLTRLLWQAGKKKPDPTLRLAPWVTSLLILLSPILVTYAFEARSYGLLAFESVLSAYIFWRAKDEIKGKIHWRLAYFVLGSIMVYTHYYAWFILASHAFYLVLFDRRRLLPMLPAALGIFLMQLPWLPTLLGQTSSVKSSYWIGAINDQTHKEFYYRVIGGDVTTPFQKPLGLITAYSIILGTAAALFRRRFGKPQLFLLTWLIIPTLLPTLVSVTVMPIFFYRYLIFSAIPLLILTVQAVKDIFNHRLALIMAAVVISYLQLRVDWTIFTNYPRSLREAIAEMYTSKVPGDGPIYTVLPAFAEVLYYVHDRDRIIVTPVGLVQFSGKSLLDAYVRLGRITIAEPPDSEPYWYISPDKSARLITPAN